MTDRIEDDPAFRKANEDHEHEFEGEPVPRRLVWCRYEGCYAVRIGSTPGRARDGVKPPSVWRELTPTEQTELTIKMWEDLIIHDTMVLIHGREHGPERARYVLGYGEPV